MAKTRARESVATAAPRASGRLRFRPNPMLLVLSLGCLVVLVVIGGIGQSISYTQVKYQLDDLKADLHNQLQMNQHLQLQVAKMQSLDRIESVAKGTLGMMEPTEVQTIVLGPQPPSSQQAGVRLAQETTVVKPNGYLAAAVKVLGRIMPALGQAEAGKIEGQ